MSKVGNWNYTMREDAEAMTRNEFIKKHGINQVDIWDTAERRRKLEDELLPKDFAIIKELKK
jgi:hypothetical protein|tara:strand:+ start:309 stop:494 length:186 start_codon:yes stop_codon:yes gene_type:complete